MIPIIDNDPHIIFLLSAHDDADLLNLFRAGVWSCPMQLFEDGEF